MRRNLDTRSRSLSIGKEKPFVSSFGPSDPCMSHAVTYVDLRAQRGGRGPSVPPKEAVGARLPSSCSFDLTLRAPSRGALQGRGPGRPSPAPPPPPPSPTLDMDRQVGHTALSRLHLRLLWSLRECGKPSLPCWWPWSPEGGFSLQSGGGGGWDGLVTG